MFFFFFFQFHSDDGGRTTQDLVRPSHPIDGIVGVSMVAAAGDAVVHGPDLDHGKMPIDFSNFVCV